MRIAAAISLPFILAISLGVVPALAQSRSDEQQIRTRIQESDQKGLVKELFTDDALFWTGAFAHPHRLNEPQATLDADSTVSPGRKNQKNVTTVDRITISGDMAFEFSTFVLTFDDNTGHQTRRGGVLRTWQRQGGVWKIAAQIQRPFGRVEFLDDAPGK